MIYPDESKIRLDIFLSNTYADRYTRSYWTNMIDNDYVSVNGLAKKCGYKLKEGDEVLISWPEITDEYSEKVSILHEDSAVLVISKPAGMLVHSKGAFNPEFTVADYLEQRLTDSDLGDSNRAGIVHRLDRYTSGVMITAKSSEMLLKLQAQFSERSTKKLYIAVVEGLVKNDTAYIDIPIARSSTSPKTFEPSLNGKEAITELLVVSRDEESQTSLVALKPHTGRTHQLRVHLKHIGHPIVGDSEYSAKPDAKLGRRFLLHAYALTLRVESELQTFVAEIPEDMSSYIHDKDAKAITELV